MFKYIAGINAQFIVRTRPPQDVDVLLVQDFQIPCPETPGFYPRFLPLSMNAMDEN